MVQFHELFFDRALPLEPPQDILLASAGFLHLAMLTKYDVVFEDLVKSLIISSGDGPGGYRHIVLLL